MRALLLLLLCLAPLGCDTDPEGSPADGGTGDAAQRFAPEDLDGARLTLVEMGDPPVTNTWTFPDGAGASGMATLEGVGPFPFTYERTAPDRALLRFSTGVEETYDLLFTGPASGTFDYSDGVGGTTTGSFEIE